jgi:polysaccharide export outer membrane protein
MKIPAAVKALLLSSLLGLGPTARSEEVTITESKNTNQNAAAASAARAARPYVISPNDQILIEVYQESDLTAPRRVGEDGGVTVPLVGSIKIGGKTIEQAQALIREQLLNGYLVNPRVTITVTEATKKSFYVLGQVAKPGPYPIAAGESITLVQAIAMAGGATSKGKLTGVIVKRPGPEKESVFSNLDVKAMQQGLTKGKDYNQFDILPEDTITVPESIF